MDTWRNSGLPRALFLLLVVSACAGTVSAQAQNTCLDCHGALDPPLQVTEQQFSSDIHSQKGLTCASCHGGDPKKADMDAMSKAVGFRGKIQRSQVPELCGRCHSDAAVQPFLTNRSVGPV
ncbi:MAG TPA: cytochrome c3 family protein [Candidatus Acidoferrum sp.]|nr:cytochrome c3 family protein [Candidatus Acidoferrum sp.]